MIQNLKSFLNNFRSSKIIPSNNFFEIVFFFAADTFLNSQDLSLSQIKIINFLVENNYIKRKFFTDRVTFKNLVLFDYIIYTIGDRGISRGTSFDQQEALGKCLGEIIERVPFRKGISYSKDIVASSLEMEKRGLSFFDYALLPKATEEQKKKNSNFYYDKNSIFEWSEVWSYAKKQYIYIPKQLTYWGFYSEKPEKVLREPNTNGLASSDTQDSAIRSALSECLQRHIFFDAWYFPKKELVTEVDLESLFKVHENLKKIQEDISCNMINFRIFRIKSKFSDIFDVYFCVLENTITGGIYLGCSGGEDSYVTIERSIQEALSIYTFTNRAFYNGEELSSYSNIGTNNFKGGIVGNQRVIWWGHYMDMEGKEILNSFLGEAKEKYVYKKTNKKFLFERVVEEFGDFFYRVSEHPINKITTQFSAVVVLANSYTLPLDEHKSTPVLGGVYPQNVKAHPFP
jgi:hypothetical protein